ncbi:MAG: peptidoglycan -binding protein [Geminicoccaceae bacterium]|nr:peptidoglycan -binding protein [Geminicoccaceae bacterium]MCS7267957.1 peptidoglycan -binding protein [Geminicoccaceae bacterium]MCX7631191.1 peptidoglycan -binding protein [Geminicoccaceae bacterium]MDW8124129.1 peptidoglycan -binding protein [Geminicoccaceae bacterium]MDW8340208.1 peptidoglycan -binding protein [Geminicoccaceae bacterium]
MLRARRSQRHAAEIWPGFVDALSTLLLGIIFLLVVFVLGQFFLSQMLEGRTETVARLEARLKSATEELEAERAAARKLRASLADLDQRLLASEAGRRELEDRLARATAEQAEQEVRLRRLAVERAGLERLLEEGRLAREDAERRTLALQRELEETKRAFAADREKLEMQLAELVELRRQVEALRAAREALLAEKAAEASGRLAAEEQVARLVARIEQLGRQLQLLETTLAEKRGEIDRQSVRIAELGQRLNEALAARVEELSQYRSDFFGRLRRVLGEREDVRIVGDRFVFQAEVLFGVGEADLGPEGQAELQKLAQTLRQIAAEIPDELPWVLQVDGHTDKRPIATARFPSNWELSTARALSVVRFLMAQGIPPQRLAARGFGEFQPLDPRDSEEAYRRNRRIELKLTTR